MPQPQSEEWRQIRRATAKAADHALRREMSRGWLLDQLRINGLATAPMVTAPMVKHLVTSADRAWLKMLGIRW